MTAEEKPKGEAELKLKELYEFWKHTNGNESHLDKVCITPEHIDLIANLVIERINKEEYSSREVKWLKRR